MDVKLVNQLKEDIFKAPSQKDQDDRVEALRRKQEEIWKSLHAGDIVRFIRGPYDGMLGWISKFRREDRATGAKMPEIIISEDNGLTFDSNKWVGEVEARDIEKIDFKAHAQETLAKWAARVKELK